MTKRETPKEAGLTYVGQLAPKQHIFHDAFTHMFEVWQCNKNHASYGLKFKNTHLEFCYSSAHILHPSK